MFSLLRERLVSSQITFSKELKETPSCKLNPVRRSWLKTTWLENNMTKTCFDVVWQGSAHCPLLFLPSRCRVYFQVFPHAATKGANQCFDADAGQGWLYEDNPDCTDTAAAYVTGDLTGTLCSLTKAFLFRSICGELPENHSQRMNLCPSEEEEEVNKGKRASDCVTVGWGWRWMKFPRVYQHKQPLGTDAAAPIYCIIFYWY